MRKAMLAATENGKRWGEFHWGDANCHPIDPGHVVWAEITLKTLQNTLNEK